MQHGAIERQPRMLGRDKRSVYSWHMADSLSRSAQIITSSAASPIALMATLSFGLIIAASMVPMDAFLKTTLIAIGTGIIVVSAVMTSIMFLRSPSLLQSERKYIGLTPLNNEGKYDDILEDISARLSFVEANMSSGDNLHDNLLKAVDERLDSRISLELSDQIIDSAYNRLEKNLDKSSKLRTIRAEFEEAEYRLKRESVRLVANGTYNLAIGGVISIIGIVTLSYYLIYENFTKFSSIDFAVHYVPRLALIVLVELLAFFFLNLYKSSRDEIKYYQNEITNIDLKRLAFEIANLSDNDIDFSTIFSVLVSSERNFTLKKGESTVEIEKDRILAGTSAAAMLANLGSILNNIKTK
jgi:hypothetical protein